MEFEQTIANAERELAKIDPGLGKLINSQGLVLHTPRSDYFSSLCRSIVGQQVSVAAARAILGRLEDATALKPGKISRLTDEQAKTIGISRQKTGYLRDLASHFAREPGVYNHLENLSDEEIVEELTEVKGIGVWTAQMFLIFSMTRLDVFAADDVGVQRGMKEFYNWDKLPAKAELIKVAEKWRPYRTIACWHLWESLKNSPA